MKPEVLDAYEIGLKGALTRFLSINSSAYYYDYKDLQVQAYGENTSVQTLRNAATAKIKGVDLELVLTPLKGIEIRGTTAYTHARYTDFARSQGFFPIPGGGNSVVQTDVSGNRMIRQPDWTESLSIAYDHPLGEGHVRVAANSYWASRTYYDAVNIASQPSYNIINASLTWYAPKDRFHVGVFGNNIGNTHYVTSFFVSGTGYVVNYGEPATIGVRAGIAF